MAEPTRTLVLSVTLDDCDLQTFRCGGKGGQNVNKRDTGVRIIHRASGARGESREQRSQLQNKRAAWERMVATSTFQTWIKVTLGRADLDEAELRRRTANRVEQDMRPENLKIEVRNSDGEWITAPDVDRPR